MQAPPHDSESARTDAHIEPSAPALLPIPTPTLFEWFTAAAILLSLIALALVRCDLTDTPYHLATARTALETFHWPNTNTFSHTFPNYPLYQQYPVYQSILYFVWSISGFEGLSILHAASWIGLFLLWVRWWGPIRWGVALSFPLMVLALGLRERMVLRPDLLTMLYFLLLLHLADLYRAGKSWSAWMMPIVMLFWVNSHQMFWVGLAIQSAFLCHLLILRYLHRLDLFETTDDKLPIRPILLAIGLSVIACFFSPIGWRVIEVPAQTFGSLYFHRQNVDEFAPFYTSRQAIWLVSVSGMAAVAGFFLRGRKQRPFEIMIWALGLAMVLGAIRGTPFFVAISLGIFARALLAWIRDPQGDRQSHLSDRLALVSRLASASIVLLLCGQVYWARWIHPTQILGGSQFGIGKTLGAWPDEAIAFLKQHLPPGKMMNLSWYSGNALIWELGHRAPVFVDPRFEAYPRSFLIDALAAEDDSTIFDRLLDEYRPAWFVGELRVSGVRAQMARLYLEGEWEFVHIDPILAIMVKRDAEQKEYLAEHRIDPSKIEPASLLHDHPELLAQQEIRLAALLAELGKLPAARRWYASAREAATFPNVAIGLAELRSNYPELEATASTESIGSSRSSQFAP